MAARVPHTFRRSGGFYQARLYWPVQFRQLFPGFKPEIRFSLGTRDPEVARSSVAEVQYLHRQIIDFVVKKEFCIINDRHKDFVSELISRLVDTSRRKTIMAMLETFYQPQSEVDNKTIIETTPDGTQRVYSDLQDPVAANKEIAEFIRFTGGAPTAFGGGSGGMDTGQSSASVEDVANKFTRHRILEGDWDDESTLKNRSYRLGQIVNQLGADKVFSSLTRADGCRVRDTLYNRMDPKAKIKEADRLKPATALSYFQLFKALAQFAVAEEYHSVDISVLLKFKKPKNSTDSYKAFTQEDIAKLVNGFIYTNEEQPRITKLLSAYFWVPLIGLFTGERLNEICQMTLDDIRFEAGVWYFNLDDEDTEEKSLKNEASKRAIPIHSTLLKAGFLDYLEERKLSKEAPGQLFSGLTWDKKNKWGKKVGRWFNEGYVKSLGLTKPDRKKFHSFRHTVAKNLRSNNTEDEHIASVVGHEGKTTTSLYGTDISPETLRWLQQLVERIDYRVPMDHLSYERFCEFQYCKGQPEKRSYLLRKFRSMAS